LVEVGALPPWFILTDAWPLCSYSGIGFAVVIVVVFIGGYFTTVLSLWRMLCRPIAVVLVSGGFAAVIVSVIAGGCFAVLVALLRGCRSFGCGFSPSASLAAVCFFLQVQL
jgi:hypothetical protein